LFLLSIIIAELRIFSNTDNRRFVRRIFLLFTFVGCASGSPNQQSNLAWRLFTAMRDNIPEVELQGREHIVLRVAASRAVAEHGDALAQGVDPRKISARYGAYVEYLCNVIDGPRKSEV